MAPRPLTVIGFLGTNRDQSTRGPARWKRWRPTVALCQHPTLSVGRLMLLHAPAFDSLADTVAADIGHVSPRTEVVRVPVKLADPWNLEQVTRALLDFASQFAFDPGAEDYLVHITTGTHVAQLAFFLLVEGRHLPARLLQTIPPPPGQSGQAGSYRIIDVDLSHFDSISRRFRKADDADIELLNDGMASANRDYDGLLRRILRVAVRSRDPILLQGPTGAGKTQLAEGIYRVKTKRGLIQGSFQPVNCATLRGDRSLSLSTLFGHVAGAYTGAHKERTGQLKAAHGGVLFLDEIGELGLEEQAMLLHAIEHKAFQPLGSDKTVRSDFQLVAATNRDLTADVRAGRFREDLLARIKLWTFTLPALRERREDIEPSLDRLLERAGQDGNRRVTMTRDGRARFLTFATSPAAWWAANFRDLRDAVRRMAVMSPSGCIGRAEVEEEIARLREEWATRETPDEDEIGGGDVLIEALGDERAAELDPFDRVQLAAVVRVCRRSRSLSDAGRALFAVSRTARKKTNDADRLRKYLARYDLSFEDLRAWPPEQGLRRRTLTSDRSRP